ncbi:hypothetical protein [Brachyspira intermedia]|nr:hypothetical protein [Brachyspira intermedia]
MKKSYIFLFIIFMFIASCGNKVTAPSVSDITYYEPNNAIRKTYYYKINDGKTDAMIAVEGTFKKLAESANAIIYVEESQIDKGITKGDILSFLREFENYIPKEIEIYGEIPDFDGNGKVIFLMANLNTNITTSITGGYFSANDLIYGKSGVPGEYLHINVPTSESTIGLMMHELQHLINYYNNAMLKNKAMDIWLNESLSESTSHLFSSTLTDSRINFFINNPYYSFYSWYFMYTDWSFVFTPGHVLLSYASSSMFMKWLDARTGGNFNIYKEIAHSDPSLTSEQRLLNITSKYGLGNDMDTVLLNWIEGVSKNEVQGLNIAPIDPTDKNFNQNGSIPLLPKSLVVYSTANNNISGNKLLTRQLGQTGLSVVINNSVNTTAGLANKEDVVNLTIKKADNLNSSIKYQRANLTDELFYIDKVID